MSELILNTIRPLAGSENDDDAFDLDLIVYINSLFSVLNQLGAGPKEGFELTEIDQPWCAFSTDKVLVNFVKHYMGAKVKLAFDPPASTALIQVYKDIADQLEWRIQVHVENKQKEDENQNGNIIL